MILIHIHGLIDEVDLNIISVKALVNHMIEGICGFSFRRRTVFEISQYLRCLCFLIDFPSPLRTGQFNRTSVGRSKILSVMDIINFGCNCSDVLSAFRFNIYRIQIIITVILSCYPVFQRGAVKYLLLTVRQIINDFCIQEFVQCVQSRVEIRVICIYSRCFIYFRIRNKTDFINCSVDCLFNLAVGFLHFQLIALRFLDDLKCVVILEIQERICRSLLILLGKFREPENDLMQQIFIE